MDQKFEKDLREIADTMALVAKTSEDMAKAMSNVSKLCVMVSERIDSELKRNPKL